MRLIWRSLWLVWCLLGLAPVGAQTPVTVVLVTSDRSAPMVGAAEALITQLEHDGPGQSHLN